MMGGAQVKALAILSQFPLRKWIKKFNAQPQRDRLAILAGGLALLVGVEVQVVMGLHDRRMSLLSSESELDPAQAQQEAQNLVTQQQELARLQAELARRSPVEGVALHAAAPQEIFADLRRTLALQAVQIMGLKAIPADQAMAPPSSALKASGAEATDEASAGQGEAGEGTSAEEPSSSASAAQSQAIYRHRVELRVSGTLAQVSALLKDFESSQKALRLEAVRLQAASGQSQDVEAKIDLVLISRERTWLAM